MAIIGSTEKKVPPQPAAASVDLASDPNLIRVYDNFGRELFLTRQQWIDSVLMGNYQSLEHA